MLCTCDTVIGTWPFKCFQYFFYLLPTIYSRQEIVRTLLIWEIWNRTSTFEMGLSKNICKIFTKQWISLFNIFKDRQTSNITCMSATSTSNQQAGPGVWLFSYLLCLLAWVAACCYSPPPQFLTQLLLVPGISTCSHHNTQPIQSSEI